MFPSYLHPCDLKNPSCQSILVFISLYRLPPTSIILLIFHGHHSSFIHSFHFHKRPQYVLIPLHFEVSLYSRPPTYLPIKSSIAALNPHHRSQALHLIRIQLNLSVSFNTHVCAPCVAVGIITCWHIVFFIHWPILTPKIFPALNNLLLSRTNYNSSFASFHEKFDQQNLSCQRTSLKFPNISSFLLFTIQINIVPYYFTVGLSLLIPL